MSPSDRNPSSTPPWSDPVAVVQIPETGLARDIAATPEQREGIAALGGLLAVEEARAELLLLPVRGGTVHVTGRVFGRVSQSCVVTLDPVDSDFDEPVDVVFAPPSQIRDLAESVDDESEDDEETPDPPEPIENGLIDLGKLATDALFLGLDPYPRKKDAVFEPLIAPLDPDEHPFAALKALQAGPGGASGKKPGKRKGT